MIRDNPNDHPHRVALVKSQIVRHVRTPHPFGESAEDEQWLRKWSADELKALHRELHEGFDG